MAKICSISYNKLKNIIQESIRECLNEAQKSDIVAYHGTPYDFIKFSTVNIGNGEGNQAFGYGLYFTSNPDVAKFYAEVVGNGQGNVYTVKISDGEFFEWYEPLDETFKTKFVEKMKQLGKDKMPIKRMLGKNGIETRYDSIENAVDYFPNGKFFYENLSVMLKGDKNASSFLSSIGIKGIVYPVGQFMKRGCTQYGTNYVIFNDSDINIINKETI